MNTGFQDLSGGDAGYLTMDNLQSPQGLSLSMKNHTQKAVFTEAFWLQPPFGRPRDIDYTNLELYEKNEWVQMVITHVMDSVIKCDYTIRSIDDKEIVQSHIDEASEFFRSKNWQESWKTGLRRMLPDLLLYDAGVLIKVFPKNAYDENQMLKGNEKPVEIVARDGRSFLKNCDLFGYTRGYYQYSWIAPHAKPIKFDNDEIIYLSMRPQSRSPYGIAPLETIKNIIDYLTASVAANRKYWENGMFIGGQIDHPDITDIDEMSDRAELYKESLKGEENYNKWLLTFGGTTVTPLAFTNQQMQWLETAEFFGRIVFAIFKITPSELGFTDGINRATSQTQSEIYKSKGVQNILDVLEEYINRELIWKHFYDDIEFKFDRSLDLDDTSKQSSIDHTRLQDGLTTINEIRTREGLDIFEDELFDQPYAEMSFQDQLMTGGEESEEPGEPEESGESEDDDLEMLADNAITVEMLEGGINGRVI